MSRNSAPRTRPQYAPNRFMLRDLFDDDELVSKLQLAEHRIMKAFARATQWQNGKMRGTNNVIIGIGPKQKNLVDHVMDKVVVGMRSPIVTVSDLPVLDGETTGQLKAIARDVEERLVAVRISKIIPHKIWFDEWNGGTWNVSMKAMDDYRLNSKIAAQAHRTDQRLRREGLHSGGRLRVVH